MILVDVSCESGSTGGAMNNEPEEGALHYAYEGCAWLGSVANGQVDTDM